MKRLIALLAAALIGLAPLGANAGMSVLTETSTSLSAMGDRAIQDLRRCLATKDTLDVYYLIDTSGSLSSESSLGRVGTDPNFVRAEVLSESLRQLSTLSEEPVGLKINWNAGFFADNFYPVPTDWMTLSTETSEQWAEVLARVIRVQSSSGTTDWLTALTSAQTELASQKRVSDGCQALIWLTDGGLNVDDDVVLSLNALNAICGQAVATGFAKPSLGYGPLYEMRQSGVTVFGVLLDVAGPGVFDSYPERKTWMQPMVEGSGALTIDGASRNVNCGDGTGVIPSGHSSGAFIRAQTPGDLAIQFLKLGGLIRGGSTSAINADGTFDINQGVANVTLLFREPLSGVTLLDASGANALQSPSVVLSEKSGASSIEIDITNLSDFGTWKITGTEPSETVLIAFSALGLNPNPDNRLVSGSESTIAVQASVKDPTVFSITDYSFDFAVYQVNQDGSYSPVGNGTDSDFESGEFSFGLTPESGLAKMNLRFEITNLVTKVGGTKLASLSLEQSLVVSLPDNFPTFMPVPLDMGTLNGRLSPAEGLITVIPPKTGGIGYFCLPDGDEVIIESDSVDRAATWSWGFDATGTSLDSDGCLQLLPGQEQTLKISAVNSTTANSQVSANIPIILKDESGAQLEVSLPVSLETVRVINPIVQAVLTVVLILLAFLLPIIMIYIINRLTTKVEHGNELLKATFLASHDLRVDSLSGRNGADIKGPALGLDEFKFQAPKKDSASFPISTHFEAKARVSLNPLVAPWFELQAKEGYRVFSGKTGKRGKAFKMGTKTEFSGQLSKLWAVTVAVADLRGLNQETSELPVSLDVFDRNASGASPDFQERMINVVNDAKIKSKLIAARDATLATEKTKSEKKPKDPENKSTGSAAPKSTAGLPPTGPGAPAGFAAPGPGKAGPPAAPGIKGAPPVAPGMPPGGPTKPNFEPPKLS